MRRLLPVALIVLATLGWLAAGLAYWRPAGGEPSPPAPVVEDQEKAKTVVNATQQKLATAQTALAVITHLRDEAAQALQEVREKSAGANKDLAAARSELDNLQQKIAAQSSELAIITKRLDTARLRESQDHKQVDASSRRIAGKTPAAAPTADFTAAPPVTATTEGERSAEANKDLAAARSELDDIQQRIAARVSELAAITKRLDIARSQEAARGTKQAKTSPTATAAIHPAPVQLAETPRESTDRNANPTAQANLPDAVPATRATKPSPETSPGQGSDRDRANLSNRSGTVAVIGPGASSYPSEFEIHSGRISTTP